MTIDRYLKYLQSEAGVAGNVAALYLFGVGWAAWRAIAASYDKAHKKCGTFRISDTRDACICRVKIKRSKERIELLKKERNKCSSRDDVQKCKDKMDKRIKYEEEIIDEQEEKLKKLEEEGRA
jgi:hypothetical protein